MKISTQKATVKTKSLFRFGNGSSQAFWDTTVTNPTTTGDTATITATLSSSCCPTGL